MLAELRRVVSGNRDVDRLRSDVAEALRPIVLLAILSGVAITGELDANGRPVDGVAFAAGTTRFIPHGLGRVPRGWFVIRDFGGVTAHSLVEEPQYIVGSTTDLDARARALHLKLVSAAACRVYLWVY